MSSGSWCTIESDPGVFTELIEQFGARGLCVEELWGLDPAAFEPLRPVYGLFFLFKWQRRERGDAVNTSDSASGEDNTDVVFLRQTVSNACGTIALLHVLLNHPELQPKIGDTLNTFREFVVGLPPEYRGHALGQYEPLRIAHNAFARPEPFEIEERAARDDDDVFHFVAYTVCGNRVLELDGLQNAPVVLGTVAPGQDWLDLASPAITRRMAEYAEGEIRFNLLALVADRRDAARSAALGYIRAAQAEYAALVAAGAAADVVDPSLEPDIASFLTHTHTHTHGEDADVVPTPVPGGLPAALESARLHLSVFTSEQDKHARWRVENARRRHNLVPVIMALLRAAAQEGVLRDMLAAGRRKAEEAREKIVAERMAAKQAAAAAAAAAST